MDGEGSAAPEGLAVFARIRLQWFVLIGVLSTAVGCAHQCQQCTCAHKCQATPSPCAPCESKPALSPAAPAELTSKVMTEDSPRVLYVAPSSSASATFVAVGNTQGQTCESESGLFSAYLHLHQSVQAPLELPKVLLAQLPLADGSAASVVATARPTERVAVETAAPEDDPNCNEAHANDYSWVIGELQYLHTRKCWRVRYAPLYIEDDYGGVVTLTGTDQQLAEHYHVGQIVKAEGVVLNPERRTTAPAFWVNSLKAIR
jgi:hypothetical protein